MRHDARRAAIAALAAASALASSAPAPRAAEACAFALPEIQAGDVVFIGVDRAVWARIASASSNPARRFGHVGVAVRGDAGELAIVHASGSPVAQNARVVAEAPERFAAVADRVGIYRLRDASAAAPFASAARTYLGRRFDKDFSLASEDTLYCTELVWRALNAVAGSDIAPEKPSVGGREIITLGAIEASPLLRETAFQNRAECGDRG